MGIWLKKAGAGEIDTGSGTRTSEESLNLAEQLQAANKRIKELEKVNRELEQLHIILLEEVLLVYLINLIILKM